MNSEINCNTLWYILFPLHFANIVILSIESAWEKIIYSNISIFFLFL